MVYKVQRFILVFATPCQKIEDMMLAYIEGNLLHAANVRGDISLPSPTQFGLMPCPNMSPFPEPELIPSPTNAAFKL